MKNRNLTIRKIVNILNNRDEDGGFWLPNIQRPFVWSEEQICRLFDSILREYPISTLLVWRTESLLRRRKFIDCWRDTISLQDFYVPEEKGRKNLVLDGQQRLQSLYIGLRGSYNGKELHFDLLSGDLGLYDDMRFRFAFMDAGTASFPFVRFRDIVDSQDSIRQLSAALVSKSGSSLNATEKDRVEDHLELVRRLFTSDEAITYQELDSIDRPTLYNEDDVVEIFIRANSGGTQLGKSDLLFSLLISQWEEAEQQMKLLLDQINAYGFSFDRDFILKTCLVLIGQRARYQVDKFRDPAVRSAIENGWNEISNAIKAVVDWMRAHTFIQGDRALPSYNVLIPLVYARYTFKTDLSTVKGADLYLLRSLLTGAFGGQSDRLIDALTDQIKKSSGFDKDAIFTVIRNQGRGLELTDDRFWQMGYGSKTIHLLFNLHYRDFAHAPSYQGNLPQIDHVFPQSLLKQVTHLNQQTGRQNMTYGDGARNQLANCMLLTRDENGAGGKGATAPSDWFADKDDAYLDRHMIPKDRSLWALDRYEEFLKSRKLLMRSRFKTLGVVD